jgi:outer membrane lipoprotein-sorting protein
LLAFLDPLLNPETSARLLPDTAGRVRLAVLQADTLMATMFDVVFELDESATRIERFWFRDAWNGKYTFRLSAQSWNPPLDDSLFRFVPPPGTEIEGENARP